MRRRTTRAKTNELLVLSGVTELAVGALTGWPYALAVYDRDKVRKLRIRSVPRLRQWHLDLIALGALTMLVGTARRGRSGSEGCQNTVRARNPSFGTLLQGCSTNTHAPPDRINAPYGVLRRWGVGANALSTARSDLGTPHPLDRSSGTFLSVREAP